MKMSFYLFFGAERTNQNELQQSILSFWCSVKRRKKKRITTMELNAAVTNYLLLFLIETKRNVTKLLTE